MVVEDDESFSSVTAIIIAVLSLIVYVLFLRPTTTETPRNTPNNNNNNTGGSRTLAANARRAGGTAGGGGGGGARQANNNNPFLGGGGGGLGGAAASTSRRRNAVSQAAVEYIQEESLMSKPSHCTTTPLAKTGIGGSNILLDDSGLIQFTQTVAANATTTNAAKLRQERAKLLTKILTSTTTSSSSSSSPSPPPSKGSTMVVSLSAKRIQSILNDTDDTTVARSLYALASYYNLLVILSSPSSEISSNKDEENVKTKILKKWDYGVAKNDNDEGNFNLSQVLPEHRILMASSAIGRIALVRQLNRVELVVDYYDSSSNGGENDDEVQKQLSRFGYKVAMFDDY